jgi:hypothetical protein
VDDRRRRYDPAAARTMIRRSFLKSIGVLGAIDRVPLLLDDASAGSPQAADDRAYWVETLTRIAAPVLTNLAQGQLRARMPVEQRATTGQGRAGVTHLEAFGRTMTGIAPWLELGVDAAAEGALRKRYIDLARAALAHAVDPRSPDFMNFTEQRQPLVDAAFLAHAVVRAPRTLWENVDGVTRRNLVTALVSTRNIVPSYSNWLLFSAMVEIALLRMGEKWDEPRVDLILRKFQEFYLGDGTFGDGPEFHWDYYNSFVIQPFLLDIFRTLRDRTDRYAAMQERQRQISRRYGVILERLIAPDGSYPAIGRSITYRFGAFQLLAQIALQNELPEELPPAQVRSALTAVIRRVMASPRTFDADGWLRIGLYGSQPDLGEGYISTGSLYLCTTVFLPLGLPPDAAFWKDAPQEWTSRKIWSGASLPADHALTLR